MVTVGSGSKVIDGLGSDVKYCLRLLTKEWRNSREAKGHIQ